MTDTSKKKLSFEERAAKVGINLTEQRLSKRERLEQHSDVVLRGIVRNTAIIMKDDGSDARSMALVILEERKAKAPAPEVAPSS